MASLPRVFTIPAAVPFLPTLAAALLEGRLVPGFAPAADPLALAAVTLYLPTRRACRTAREILFEAAGRDGAVLPRIVALGDIDEDELAFSAAGPAGPATEGGALPEALELPPALPGLSRRLLLARLVLAWARSLRPKTAGEAPVVVDTPAAALAMADQLARLIDDMTTRDVPWTALDTLVPDEHDRYWGLTLDFLRVAREHWPAVLAERQTIEPAARRDLLIRAEAARVAARAEGPVIVAGSTGSMPATARFIATVARLPHGAVVLPGLDTALDDASWDAIAGLADGSGLAPEPESGHPQFALHGLLETIGLRRGEIVVLGASPRHDRAALMSEALRPAPTTHLWQQRLLAEDFTGAVRDGLPGLSVIEAANAEEEALAIAVVLRETLEHPGRTAALATPDRALARRVAAALGRWGVTVSDTGGQPLADAPAGVFARLAAETALDDVAPVPLLALLKHPLARLGRDAPEHGRAVAALERAALRGPRPRPGTAGLAHALATVCREVAKLQAGEESAIHPADPRARLQPHELAAATALVERLTAALAPLETLDSRKPQPLAVLAAAHRQVVEALSDGGGGVEAFAGPDGNALADTFEALADEEAAQGFPVATEDYAELFRTAVADRVVRPPPVPGARLHILGLLEARLVTVDRFVLGGLAEGVWPPAATSDPWLSRGMRHALGLDLPERRIGLSAHDFAQLAGSAPEVVLTRPGKVGGAPVAASRFLQRLAAVAGPAWTDVVRRGEAWLDLARKLDRPEGPPKRVPRPEPRPPRDARPVSLSVTEIEHWLRDPYTIYAKHILGLAPLDPVDLPPGVKDRGIAIHAAIGTFSARYAEALPEDPLAALLEIGRKEFDKLDDTPEARAFWWPRFTEIARWFVRFERERRADGTAVTAEIRGTLDIPLRDGRAFRLKTRADRIERRSDGSFAILDFKTGAPPTSKQVRLGLSPQLTLEGAILRGGGFEGLPAGASLAEIAYVRLTGGDPAGDCCPVDLETQTPDAAADRALGKLIALVKTFDDETTPYRSLVLSMWKSRYGTYDDLARVKEWSTGEGGGE